MNGRTKRRGGWLAVLATLVAAGGLRGQEVAEPEVAAREAWAWTGVVLDGDEMPAPLPASEEWLAVLRHPLQGDESIVRARRDRVAKVVLDELARIELAMKVDRDFAAAEANLKGLWMAASLAAGYPEQMDVLVRVAVTRAELLLELGRAAEASSALDHLWLDLEALGWSPDPELFVPVGDSQLEAEAEGLADPRLTTLRESVETITARGQAGAGGLDGAGSDPLLERVRQAVARGDWHFVQVDCGAVAIPALKTLVSQDLEGFPENRSSDPLYYLVSVAEVEAAKTIQELFEQGGYFWHRRILRAMQNTEALKNEGTWQYADERTPPICRELQWLDVIERLIRDPESTRGCWSMVSYVAGRDALTPGMQEALIQALGRGDTDLVNECLQALEPCWGTETSRSVLEALLHHAHPPARVFAAARLASLEDIGALRDCAQHPDPEVRVHLAGTLRDGQHPRVLFGDRDYFKTEHHLVRRSPRPGDAHLLRLLLRSSEPPVRRAAAATAVRGELGASLGLMDFVVLARDPNESVRSVLCELEHPDPSVMKELMARLARDPSPRVLERADWRLGKVDWEGALDVWLPVFMERWAHPQLPLHETMTANESRSLLSAVVQQADSASTLVPWGLERDDDLLFRAIENCGKASTAYSNWVDLPPEVQAAAIEKVASLGDLSLHASYALCNELRALMPRPAEGLLLAAGNAELPVYARLRVLHALTPGLGASRQGEQAAPVPEAAFRQAFMDCLRDPAWATEPPDGSWSGWLEALYDEIPARLRGELLVSVVRDRRIGDDRALALAYRQCRGVEGNYTWEQVSAILDRWLRAEVEDSRVVPKALRSMGNFPEHASPELLIELVRVPEYTSSVMSAMLMLHDPVYLDALGECLCSPSWIGHELERRRVRMQAANKLAAFPSDEAAAHLLAGLDSTSDEDVREVCLASLQAIRRYQEEKERWAARFAGAAARELGAAKLMAMLDDEDEAIRIEAVRALGTFGAVEAMPRLIELLRSDSEVLREAVREALDRLNRLGERDG